MLFTSLSFTFEAATTRKDTEKKPKLLYEIVPTVVLYLVCAKADHVDPNQMRGLLSPLYRSFRRDLFTVIPYDAIVN